MKVLITGASGFLGSHIVDRCLAQGDSVRVLVREGSDLSYLKYLPQDQLDFVEGDLSDRSNLAVLHKAAENVDVVYHSAARVLDYGSRRDFYETNVRGTQRLVEAAKACGVKRFIFVGSPSACMDLKDQLDVDESYPFPKRFLNLYSETKAVAETFVLSSNTKDFITCSLRPRAVWGPRDKTGFLPRVVGAMAGGKLRDISGGKKVLASLCYCENAAEACILAAKSDRVGGKAYFVTDLEKIDVWQFSSVLAEIFGVPPVTRKLRPALVNALAGAADTLWKVPYLAHRVPPPISRYSVGLVTLSSTFDCGAAQRDFNYFPKVDQQTGLARLKEWVNQIGGVEEFTRLTR